MNRGLGKDDGVFGTGGGSGGRSWRARGPFARTSAFGGGDGVDQVFRLVEYVQGPAVHVPVAEDQLEVSDLSGLMTYEKLLTFVTRRWY